MLVDIGKGNIDSLLVAMETGAAAIEINLQLSPNPGYSCIICPSYTIPEDILKDSRSYHSNICIFMLIVALFTIARK